MPNIIKVHLKKNGTEEIRRFRVNDANTGSFAKIKDKIIQIHPSLAHGNFTLRWQVTFSSDEELEDALSGDVEEEILHIFISETEATPELTDDADVQKCYTEVKQEEQICHLPRDPDLLVDLSVHEGTMCDSCRFPVVGVRYKCKECLDYDLCETCERAGQHDEHDMLVIDKPLWTRPAIRDGSV